LLSKTLLFFLLFAVCAFAQRGVLLEFRNGETERVKRASFDEKVVFRTQGRSVNINPRKIYKIEFFADSIEIHWGETWLRARVHPRSRGEEVLNPTLGWMKIGTTLRGNSTFGRIAVSVTELSLIQFREPEPAPNGGLANGQNAAVVQSPPNGQNEEAEITANGAQTNADANGQAQETANGQGAGGGSE